MCSRVIEAIINTNEVPTTALIIIEIHDSGRDEYTLKVGAYPNTMEKFNAFVGLKLLHLILSTTDQYHAGSFRECQPCIGFLQSQQNDDTFDLFHIRIVED